MLIQQLQFQHNLSKHLKQKQLSRTYSQVHELTAAVLMQQYNE